MSDLLFASLEEKAFFNFHSMSAFKGSSWEVTGRFGPIPVRTPGRFGPIPFRSGRFGLGRFGPISGVGRFGPILAGRFGPL